MPKKSSQRSAGKGKSKASPSPRQARPASSPRRANESSSATKPASSANGDDSEPELEVEPLATPSLATPLATPSSADQAESLAAREPAAAPDLAAPDLAAPAALLGSEDQKPSEHQSVAALQARLAELVSSAEISAANAAAELSATRAEMALTQQELLDTKAELTGLKAEVAELKDIGQVNPAQQDEHAELIKARTSISLLQREKDAIHQKFEASKASIELQVQAHRLLEEMTDVRQPGLAQEEEKYYRWGQSK